MNVQAKLVEKTSKNGRQYLCIEIYITDTYTKLVMLDKAELELLKLTAKKTQ